MVVKKTKHKIERHLAFAFEAEIDQAYPLPFCALLLFPFWLWILDWEMLHILIGLELFFEGAALPGCDCG